MPAKTAPPASPRSQLFPSSEMRIEISFLPRTLGSCSAASSFWNAPAHVMRNEISYLNKKKRKLARYSGDKHFRSVSTEIDLPENFSSRIHRGRPVRLVALDGFVLITIQNTLVDKESQNGVRRGVSHKLGRNQFLPDERASSCIQAHETGDMRILRRKILQEVRGVWIECRIDALSLNHEIAGKTHLPAPELIAMRRIRGPDAIPEHP